jgi:hypothetical protein
VDHNVRVEVVESITVVVVVQGTILVVLQMIYNHSESKSLMKVHSITYIIVVVTAIGTSGPAVISGQDSLGLHRLATVTGRSVGVG